MPFQKPSQEDTSSIDLQECNVSVCISAAQYTIVEHRDIDTRVCTGTKQWWITNTTDEQIESHKKGTQRQTYLQPYNHRI